MDLVLPIWQNFDPLPDLGRRLGALVGAVGCEAADEFEIRFRDSEPEDLGHTVGVPWSGLMNDAGERWRSTSV